MTTAAQTKQALRREATARLATPDAETMALASAVIVEHLKVSPLLATAAGIATFAAWRQEPDLRALTAWATAAGRAVYYPRYDAAVGRYTLGRVGAYAELVAGQHGILEPTATAAQPSDDERRRLLWLVPGLAFDSAGRRLGRGAGDYDRLLADVTGPRVAVAFALQLLPALPAEAHDVPMQALATETGVLAATPTTVKTT